jgi:phage-related baseplate assembly protein
MSNYAPIDLSTLPAPAVVETLDYEVILAQMLADLQSRDPAFTALVESDPAYKVLEVAAYRETIIRARINASAKGTMLAYAVGSDLDNLAALLNVSRKTLVPANLTAIPPVAAVMESDYDLRSRAQLAMEGISTAGPSGSYAYHALSITTIKDVAVAGPPTVAAGNVRVTVLSRTSTASVGATSAELAAVNAILSSEDVRPLTDALTVQAATVVPYTLNITLKVLSGWDATITKTTAEAKIRAYAESVRRVGFDVRISGIYGAAFVAGVESVVLNSVSGSLTADLSISDVQASFLNGLTITTATATP